MIATTFNEELDCGFEQGCVYLPKNTPNTNLVNSSSKQEGKITSVSFTCGKSDCGLNCCLQADVMPTSTNTTESTNENVRFVDAEEGVAVGIDRPYDGISAGDQTENIDFVKFLSRPVRIGNFTWNESDPVGTIRTFDPWFLFFNDTRVKYKLNNFSFIQCKLKIKVLVNASPFYYGYMIMSYQPQQNLTPSTIVNDTGTRFFIPYSQRPHLWIKPQTNEAGEMTLPFFSQKNFINAQLAQSFTDMGRLSFINYTALQSANGVSSSGVSVAIYAWAEDVKLSGPSVGLALQSDEYGNGCVSAPATAIANGASWFENIPIIGPFATATRIGASAVSAIASLFGFTNVPVITDTQPFRSEPFPKLASSDIGYPIEKLTLDPKNELTVDPKILGLEGDDEMILSNLAQKESYLTTATWSTSNSVDDILFSSRVQPALFDNDGGTPASKTYLTPMAWISSLFLHWRGDVIFTFRVVASPFHKGRLRITYDPSGYAGENIVTDSVSSNVVFTSIIDLTDQNEIEFRVPYQQATAFLLSANTYNVIPWSTSLTPTFARDNSYDNGYLTVRVQTALTAPIATSSVNILCSVRAAENMEFANPRNAGPFTTFPVQSDSFNSGVVGYLAGTSEPNVHADRYLVNFGESIKSFRQLLRRSAYVSTSSLGGTPSTDISIWRKTFTKIPGGYGYDPHGINSAKGLVVPASNFPFNYSQLIPLHAIMPAFIGYRGSTHYSFNVQGRDAVGSVRVSRLNGRGAANTTETITSFTSGTSSANSAFFRNNLEAGAAGQAVTSQLTNAGMNISCPNYSMFRFQSTNPANWSFPTVTDGSFYDTYVLEAVVDGNTNTSAQELLVHAYHSIGTDFGLYFFLNVPTFYAYPVPTAN